MFSSACLALTTGSRHNLPVHQNLARTITPWAIDRLGVDVRVPGRHSGRSAER
jgi:hypothetical protein